MSCQRAGTVRNVPYQKFEALRMSGTMEDVQSAMLNVQTCEMSRCNVTFLFHRPKCYRSPCRLTRSCSRRNLGQGRPESRSEWCPPCCGASEREVESILRMYTDWFRLVPFSYRLEPDFVCARVRRHVVSSSASRGGSSTKVPTAPQQRWQ